MGATSLCKAERDIYITLFHNQRVSTLTERPVHVRPNDLVGRYAEMSGTKRVHERDLFAAPRTPSELELQARWFAGDFGKEFVSTTGDQIEIVQFGVWNRAAGSDFRDAADSDQQRSTDSRLHRNRSARSQLGIAWSRDESGV